MSFEIQEKEGLAHAAKRLLKEEVDEALELLKRGVRLKKSKDQDDMVHEVRKSFKKIRAVLRIIRTEIGETAFRRENNLIRDAGRKLSKLRDSEVLVGTLESLIQKDDKSGVIKNYKTIKAHLLKQKEQSRKEIFNNPQVLESVRAELDEFKKHLRDWKLKGTNWPVIQTNVKEIYRKGQKALKKSLANSSADSFHELRKQAKYLRHMIEVLEPLWPGVLKQLEEEAHRLSDLLGEDHDLAVLKQTLKTESKHPQISSQVTRLKKRIGPRRKKLEGKAICLAKRVYADSPKEFAYHLKSYWKAWKEEVRL